MNQTLFLKCVKTLNYRNLIFKEPLKLHQLNIFIGSNNSGKSNHSPDLLDHFTDCLENVFCFNSIDQVHFNIEPLSRELLDDKLNEGWELGDLYRVVEYPKKGEFYFTRIV